MESVFTTMPCFATAFAFFLSIFGSLLPPGMNELRSMLETSSSSSEYSGAAV
jgi:hypothetical protein